MARHYNTAEFEKKYFELKEALPGISITTDVIVGFPGETEEDFVDTYNWIKKLHFNQLLFSLIQEEREHQQIECLVRCQEMSKKTVLEDYCSFLMN